MNYVDIAIIAIIALFALIGLWKGFGKTFIKLFCFALALVATWFIASYALSSLLSVGFVRNLVTGSGKISLYSMYYNSLSEEVLNATAATKLDGAMGMFINPMIARFTALGGPDAYNITYAQFVALNLSINTLSVVLCLVLYIVVRLAYRLDSQKDFPSRRSPRLEPFRRVLVRRGARCGDRYGRAYRVHRRVPVRVRERLRRNRG